MGCGWQEWTNLSKKGTALHSQEVHIETLLGKLLNIFYYLLTKLPGYLKLRMELKNFAGCLENEDSENENVELIS